MSTTTHECFLQAISRRAGVHSHQAAHIMGQPVKHPFTWLWSLTPGGRKGRVRSVRGSRFSSILLARCGASPVSSSPKPKHLAAGQGLCKILVWWYKALPVEESPDIKLPTRWRRSVQRLTEQGPQKKTDHAGSDKSTAFSLHLGTSI